MKSFFHRAGLCLLATSIVTQPGACVVLPDRSLLHQTLSGHFSSQALAARVGAVPLHHPEESGGLPILLMQEASMALRNSTQPRRPRWRRMLEPTRPADGLILFSGNFRPIKGLPVRKEIIALARKEKIHVHAGPLPKDHALAWLDNYSRGIFIEPELLEKLARHHDLSMPELRATFRMPRTCDYLAHVGDWASWEGHDTLLEEIFHGLEGLRTWTRRDRRRYRDHRERVNAFLRLMFYPSQRISERHKYVFWDSQEALSLQRHYRDEPHIDPNRRLREILFALREDLATGKPIRIGDTERSISSLLAGAAWLKKGTWWQRQRRHNFDTGRLIQYLDLLLKTERFSQYSVLFPSWNVGPAPSQERRQRKTNPTHTGEYGAGRSLDFQTLRNKIYDAMRSHLVGAQSREEEVSLGTFVTEQVFKQLVDVISTGGLVTGFTGEDLHWFKRYFEAHVLTDMEVRPGEYSSVMPTLHLPSSNDPSKKYAVRRVVDDGSGDFEAKFEEELLKTVHFREKGGVLRASRDDLDHHAIELAEAYYEAVKAHAEWRSKPTHSLESELAASYPNGFDVEVRLGGHSYVEIDFEGERPVIIVPLSRLPDRRREDYEWMKKRLKADFTSEVHHLLNPRQHDSEIEPEAFVIYAASEGLESVLNIYGKFLATSPFALIVHRAVVHFFWDHDGSERVNKMSFRQQAEAFLKDTSTRLGRKYMDTIFTPDLWDSLCDRYYIDFEGTQRERYTHPLVSSQPHRTGRLFIRAA